MEEGLDIRTKPEIIVFYGYPFPIATKWIYTSNNLTQAALTKKQESDLIRIWMFFFSRNETENVTEFKWVNLRITTFFCNGNYGDDENTRF